MSRALPSADSQELVSMAPIPPPSKHPVNVYIKHLGPGSRRAMTDALNVIAKLLTGADWVEVEGKSKLVGGQLDAENLPWPALGHEHTAAIRAKLAEKYAPSNANKHLAALKGVLKECWRFGYMDAEQYARATDIESVKGERLPAGRSLTLGEVGALFAATGKDATPAGARDSALLALLYGGGLRRSEVVGLTRQDYVDGVLTVRGKGNKEREVFVTNGAEDALAAWLEIRGDGDGPLFYPVDKSGRVTQRQMSDQAVLLILRRRAKQAGVRRLSPHDLRRSFITHMLENGADLAVVQRLAGHRSPMTTAKYDRRGSEAARKASELLHIPYVRKEPQS